MGSPITSRHWFFYHLGVLRWFPGSLTWRLNLVFTSLTHFTHTPIGESPRRSFRVASSISLPHSRINTSQTKVTISIVPNEFPYYLWFLVAKVFRCLKIVFSTCHLSPWLSQLPHSSSLSEVCELPSWPYVSASTVSTSKIRSSPQNVQSRATWKSHAFRCTVSPPV